MFNTKFVRLTKYQPQKRIQHPFFSVLVTLYAKQIFIKAYSENKRYTYLDVLRFENYSMSSFADISKNCVLSTVLHDNSVQLQVLLVHY